MGGVEGCIVNSHVEAAASPAVRSPVRLIGSTERNKDGVWLICEFYKYTTYKSRKLYLNCQQDLLYFPVY